MAEQQQGPSMSEREYKRAQRIAMYGSNIPKSGQRAAFAQAQDTAAKRAAAIDAGYVPPPPPSTNASLNAALPGETPAQMVARQRASRMGVTATTTPPAGTPPAANRPAGPEPISKIGGVPASEALSKLRERATASANKIADPAQREAAMPFGPTSAERFTASQVLKDKLAADKLNAGIASSTLPAVSTQGLRPYTPTTPTKAPTTPTKAPTTPTTPTTPTDSGPKIISEPTETSGGGGISPTAAGLLLRAPNLAESLTRKAAMPFFNKATGLLVDAGKATMDAEEARRLGSVYKSYKALEDAKEAAAYGKAARLTKQAARPELIGKIISKAGKVGKFGKVAGKLAVPVEIALNVIEAGRLIGDDEFRARRKAEFEDYANKGALRSAAESALNPVSGIYSAVALRRDRSESNEAAKRATAAFDKASSVNEARLKYLSDIGMTPDKLKALPQKERSQIMAEARKSARA